MYDKGSSSPLMVDVKLNGQLTPMEVDTGDSAAVLLLGEVHFKPLREKGV